MVIKERLIASLFIASLCVCINGNAGPLDDLLKTVKSNIPLNPFDKVGSEFNRSVEEKEFDKALLIFNDKYESYFNVRYNVEKADVTSQLKDLGKWYFERSFAERLKDASNNLRQITDLSKDTGGAWIAAKNRISEARALEEELDASKLLKISRLGDAAKAPLLVELNRVIDVAVRDRQTAFRATFADVLMSVDTTSNYPYKKFDVQEYKDSGSFQSLLIAEIEKSSSEDKNAVIKKLAPITADTTAKKIKNDVSLKLALEKLGPAPYPFEKLGELRALVAEFGASSNLQNAVKIGYVDLTATSFKDRNVFDFELAFEKDYGLAVEDAKEAFLGKSQIVGYDYIFVTDLSTAKILREFKNKREVASKAQTGTRQENNPEYVQAMSAYQQAMTNMQATKLQNAASANQPCYASPLACALLGGLKGLADGGSERAFKEKADQLARTPQTVAQPVYGKYNYQLVDVSTAKIARVDYYVIDVREKKVFTNFFEIKDREKFVVSYNVEENDPDAARIIGNARREEDVTAWEKKPLTVKLSALFDPANIDRTTASKFSSVEAFLKPLASRSYVSASPNYSTGGAIKNEPFASRSNTSASPNSSAGSTVKGESIASSSRVNSGVIADERFDSVLIIKTSKAVGTGFYVTPDLVLTAFHVVDGSNLVEMISFDGAKTFGKVIDSDVRLDLALIKAQTVGKPVKIHSGPIRLGETAEAIGHPKGYEFTITRGVVSAMRKQSGAVLKAGPPIEFIQTDTPISPGNSGGPLFLKDSVIGVNDWVRVDKASQNLNFSVSYNEIREYLNRFDGKNK